MTSRGNYSRRANLTIPFWSKKTPPLQKRIITWKTRFLKNQHQRTADLFGALLQGTAWTESWWLVLPRKLPRRRAAGLTVRIQRCWVEASHGSSFMADGAWWSRIFCWEVFVVLVWFWNLCATVSWKHCINDWRGWWSTTFDSPCATLRPIRLFVEIACNKCPSNS